MLEEIKLLRVEKGMSAQKIGEELGVSQYMVLQALKEIGLDPSDRNPRKAALLPTVTKMNKDGMTLTEISAATGVPSSTISRWLEGSREERSEEHTSELQSREKLVCRLLLETKK